MKAVVTGGCGFIGSHLVDALVERGDEVAVIDDERSGSNKRPDVTYVNMDLGRRIPELTKKVDVVFHCAAIGRTPWAVSDPVGCFETNLLGSVRVLEAARRAEVQKVVLSSSNIVYAPSTPYKESKLAMEAAAQVYTELYGLDTICLHYGNTYGPRQREDGVGTPNVFAALRKTLRDEGVVRLSGNGEQTRDFIYVSDVVTANLLAANSPEYGAYDICTGKNWSMNQIAGLLDAEVRYGPERKGDAKHIVQDPLPALEELGFLATVKLEDGIRTCFPVLA